MWRLTVEMREGREFSEAAEERAGKIAGVLDMPPLGAVGQKIDITLQQ